MIYIRINPATTFNFTNPSCTKQAKSTVLNVCNRNRSLMSHSYFDTVIVLTIQNQNRVAVWYKQYGTSCFRRSPRGIDPLIESSP